MSPGGVARAGAALGALLAALGCGGPTETTRTVSTVEVTPSAAALAFVGESVSLTARAKDPRGSTVAGKRFEWSSSDPAVATVSTAGVVTAAADGTATITASTEGKSGSATVTVSQAVVSVDVAPEADTVVAGTTARLTAVASDAGGTPVAAASFTWSSSDDAVATVDGDGVVTAIAQGSVTIAAEASGQRDSADVVVTVPVPMACGDLLSGALSVPGELDVFTFTAASGNRVLVTAVETGGFAGAAAPQATVVAPSGATLGFARNGQILFPLSEDGDYEIRVQGTAAEDTGSYAVGLECLVPSSPDAVPLAAGDVIAGSLDAAGETDLFTVDAASGDQILLAIAATGGFAGAAPQATLFSPSGTSVGRLFEANAQEQFVLAETGTYLVRVRATTLTDTGTYNVGLERLRPLSADTVQIGGGDLLGGSIGAAAETDLFVLDGADDDRLLLTLVTTSGFDESAPEAALFAPSGARVAGPFAADSQIAVTLTEDGVHTLRVTSATLADTGGYNLGLETLRPLGPGTEPIATGDLVGGSIDLAGETDLFSFTGEADDRTFVTIVETGGFAGTPAPQATVFGPDGTSLNSVSGNGQLLVTLPTSGTYVVRVRATTLVDTGTYNLGLERLLPLGPDTLPIALGDIVEDTIGAPGETDLFAFDGTADDIVFFTIVETGGFTGTPAPQVTLFAPSGTQVAASFLANIQQQFTLPETGPYVVRVRDVGLTATGTYALGLEGIRPPTPDTVSLAPGGLLVGAIEAAAETDLLAFPASVDDQLLVTVVETGGFTGAAAPSITVYAPSGAQVGPPLDANAQLLLPLSESGTYLVRVRASTLTATGEYAVGLEGIVPPSPDAVPSALGDLVAGTIDAAGETDLYTFTAQSEDEIFVTVLETAGFGGSAAPNVAVFAPSGAQVASSFNANVQTIVALPETGAYVLRVRANDLVTAGSYTVGIEGLRPRSGDTVQIALGDLATGSIDVPGQTDLITFAADEGDRILVAAVATAGFTGSPAPNVAVFAPSGAQVASAFNANSQQVYTLTESGSHLIRVRASDLLATGTYTVGLEGLIPPSPDTVQTVVGGLVSGAIDAPGETDLFTFPAGAGDEVFVAVVSTGGFAGEPAPQATVFAPSGAQVASPFEANDQVRMTLPETGTYTIRARTNTLTGEGTYNVGIEGLLPLTPDTVRIGVGDVLGGSLDGAGATDLYVFTAQADDAVTLTLSETGGFEGPATAEATLFSPSGAELGTLTANGVTGFTLAEDGLYVIRVRATPLTVTGTYNVGLQ